MELAPGRLAHRTVVQVQMYAAGVCHVSLLSSIILCCRSVSDLVDVDALQLVGQRVQVLFHSVDLIEVLCEEAIKLVFMLRHQPGLVRGYPPAPS